MLGSELMYAPQIFKDKVCRELYIPEGVWVDYNTGKRVKGRIWITTTERLPIYVSEDLYKRYGKK
ncbi:MAG: glycoside hydrolase family 31 protein, partial [Candidatus Thermoplasmatota archaeon]|jgi:alpha-glucosidase (family GH31 glycosyl hydrolase)|nr:glycoside hydrolase family 31 protein [Candidatus Thermoplasmatota archaeon]